MSSVHILPVSHSVSLAARELEPARSLRRAEDSRETGILLSDAIHFPSHKVHLDVSVGGGVLLLLAGHRSTAGRWLENSGSRERGDITRDFKVMRRNI